MTLARVALPEPCHTTPLRCPQEPANEPLLHQLLDATCGRAHYRCRYPNEYAIANGVPHPRSVYVREDAVLPRLDAWLGRLFDPANLDATGAALAAANGDDTTAVKIERCRRALVDCEQRLARYRAALEAGTAPNVIAQRTAEVQAEQAQAEHDLRSAQKAHEHPASRKELEALIRDADDLVTVLTRTDAGDRAARYAALGLRLSHQPDERRVVVECRPAGQPLGKGLCRRGDLNPQDPKVTWPSTMRVCQFRHADRKPRVCQRGHPAAKVQSASGAPSSLSPAAIPATLPARSACRRDGSSDHPRRSPSARTPPPPAGPSAASGPARWWRH